MRMLLVGEFWLAPMTATLERWKDRLTPTSNITYSTPLFQQNQEDHFCKYF